MLPDERSIQEGESSPGNNLQGSSADSAPSHDTDELSISAKNKRGRAHSGSQTNATHPVPKLPERISINLHRLADSFVAWLQQHSEIDTELEQPLAPNGFWKSWLPRFGKALGGLIKDFGPLATGFFTAIIAFLVFHYGQQIQKQQADTAEAEFQFKVLTEFSNNVVELGPDKGNSTTRDLAAIRLAQYGEKALRLLPLRTYLGTANIDIRTGAKLVVFYMFQVGNFERSKLIASLLDYFQSSNLYLRRGAIECFVDVVSYLSDDEKKNVVALLKDKLKLEDCAEGQEKAVIEQEEAIFEQAAIFFGHSPSGDSKDLLLKLAGNGYCPSGPRTQAIDQLRKVAEQLVLAKALTPQERDTIVARLEELKRADVQNELSPSLGSTIEAIRKMGGPIR